MNISLPTSIEQAVQGKVPTLDEDVRLELRKLGEPVTYFGEDKSDRRNRLIKLIEKLKSEKSTIDDVSAMYEDEQQSDEMDEDEEQDEDEEFWTPGPEELLDIRYDLTKFSLNGTKSRIIQQQRESEIEFTEVLKYRRGINSGLSKFDLVGSNIISTRAVSASKFSPHNDSLIAIGTWAGDLKILNADTLETSKDIGAPIKSHANQLHNKISGLDWYPTPSQDPNSICLASSNSNDNSILLWSLNSANPLASLSGHESRIIDTKFHPQGKLLASSSYDRTWRLWDLQTQKELYLQEGHAKEVHSIGFQKDGALIASGGLDAIGRIWDLRTGKEIMSLYGHVKDIMCLDWSDNGYQVTTGSKDGTIKIWDLRYTPNKMNNVGYKEYLYNDRPLFTIPAHNKLVSGLTFFHHNQGTQLADFLRNDLPVNPSSKFLLSSSYDGTLKIWSADNWVNVKTLRGHIDNKIMSCDISSTGDKIVSSGWDRSIKLWSTNDFI
ncbi:U4/U6-U5 snRNP complex subunit [Saccharomycopsis crataegensis]|uniref:U4/U6-U5 snRNP complex subunit n=1 Tax=Saccharomycopsis crataegensis TaxID=43959 RepID=A0AAV5QVQ1_9ASCO|nr:U4/U6-U5 snRNP complex subunit [Saccharomycopsis crataegensis]